MGLQFTLQYSVKVSYLTAKCQSKIGYTNFIFSENIKIIINSKLIFNAMGESRVQNRYPK